MPALIMNRSTPETRKPPGGGFRSVKPDGSD
jgi:hypothetical protein